MRKRERDNYVFPIMYIIMYIPIDRQTETNRIISSVSRRYVMGRMYAN